MKDTSRLPTTPTRSAPYRKRFISGPVSPTRRGSRREHDASKPHGRTSSPDRAYSSSRRRDAIPFVDDDCRSQHPKTGGDHDVPRPRKYSSSADESARHRPSHTSALSAHADVPGPSLRLPLVSAPSTSSAHTSDGPTKAESPLPGSVTAFLRSIELPSSVPPPQTSSLSSSTPPSLRLPPLSTDMANKGIAGTYTNGNDYQVGLAYKGYPFTYNLSALPDDPMGVIALLTITKSDPGAYILVGAHYRRTGRSRAACAVIRSLLDDLDSSPDVDREKEKRYCNTPHVTVSDTSAVTTATTLPSPGSPGPPSATRNSCPRSGTVTDRTPASVFKGAAMRPAMLLLAACELDISREHPDDPESDAHASKAHELLRNVYGIDNDAVITGAMRPKPINTVVGASGKNNALGLEFSSNRNCTGTAASIISARPPPPLPDTVVPLARFKDLEKELSAARGTQKSLQEKLVVSNDRVACAEDKVRTLESRAREMHAQLDASRDENWELRQRLASSEQRTRELVQCTPTAESRVWGRLKDLLFDNLGGGMRGE